MREAFIRVIETAEAVGRYVNSEELDALKDLVVSGQQRMEILSYITGNPSKIVADAARTLFAEQPQLIAPGGNAYPSLRMAACVRDMDIILRYITYAFFAGDASVLEERCLAGLRETYLALGVPTNSVASAIQKMKEGTLNLFILQENQGDSRELTISEIRKFYPKQWVTMEVTKSEGGFPVRGRVLYYNHDVAKLAERTRQLSGDKIHTLFTSKIDEKPEPLIRTNANKLAITSGHQYLLVELASYFDRVVASIS